ncbi:ankyrin repeat domain-containing protein [bacterium]|jgi:ankyrin repeat protein|nr:ankyrin repeat domain-containing protein [bacterium]
MDLSGMSALHLAAKRDDTDMVIYLLEKGADGSLRNKKNQTPMDLATGFSGQALQFSVASRARH